MGFVKEETIQLTLSSVMGGDTNTNQFSFLEKDKKMEQPVMKVNYSNGSNLTPNQQLMFKNLEWGINLESSTMYLSYVK